MEIPDAPVYYPTKDEFMDPLNYIQKYAHAIIKTNNFFNLQLSSYGDTFSTNKKLIRIRPEAEQFGICKIVPPPEWDPSCQVSMSNPKKFATKLQYVHTLQEGQGFDEGKFYNIASYKEMADKFKAFWLKVRGKQLCCCMPVKQANAKQYYR